MRRRNKNDRAFRVKQEFIRNEYGVDEDEFYAYDAIRQEGSHNERYR